MAIHAAKHHGVRAVGVTLSQRQAEWARRAVQEAGLADRIEIRVQDYRDVRDGPFDAISSIGMFEHVGAATWEQSVLACAWGGRIVVCGATTGPNPPAALHRIWWKQLTIYGSTMGTREDFESAYELVKSGLAKPVVDSVFPLAEAQAAHERMEAAEQFGKIVLTIPD